MKKIKLFDPAIGNEEEKSIVKTLRSHLWASGSGGGHVKEFENKFKNYVKSRDCIAVNSGTAALNLVIFNGRNISVYLQFLFKLRLDTKYLL